MSQWRHAGAYVASFAVVAVGCVALACGVEWPGVAAVALSVALLLGFRALESVEAVSAAKVESTAIEALQRQVAELKETSSKASETAADALRTARATAERRNHQSY